MMILLYFTSMVTFLFLFSSPLLLFLTVLFLTILIASSLMLLSSMNWFSYLLILVFLGGMLIMFAYIISLSQKINISMKTSSFTNLTMMFLLIPFLMLMNFYPQPPSLQMWNIMTNSSTLISNLWAYQTLPSYLYLFLYLLMVMIVIVSFLKTYSSPLRSLN